MQIAEGAYFPIHPDLRQRIAILFPERECIGNYPSNSRGVLTVYKFNTLPLYKKRIVVTEDEEEWEIYFEIS